MSWHNKHQDTASHCSFSLLSYAGVQLHNWYVPAPQGPNCPVHDAWSRTKRAKRILKWSVSNSCSIAFLSQSQNHSFLRRFCFVLFSLRNYARPFVSVAAADNVPRWTVKLTTRSPIVEIFSRAIGEGQDSFPVYFGSPTDWQSLEVLRHMLWRQKV